LGEQTLVVDDIVTTSKLNEVLNAALFDYAKKTDVQDLLKEATDNLKSDLFDEISETYATKSEVEELAKDIEGIGTTLGDYLTKEDAAGTYLRQDKAEELYFTKNAAETSGWMTEPEIILSIQTGEIGNAIAISNEQIENMTTSNI
jgi:C-terminal processing protease CtpA/Prc